MRRYKTKASLLALLTLALPLALLACGQDDRGARQEADLAGSLDMGGDALDEDMSQVEADLPPEEDMQDPACPPLSWEAPTCEVVEAAPTEDQEAFDQQLMAQAQPLLCEQEWALSPLRQLAQEADVFLFGEIHGAENIRLLARRLVRELQPEGFLDVVLEVNMDYTEPYEIFAQTGQGPLLEDYFYRRTPRLELHRVYADLAYELRQEGITLRLHGADMPLYGSWAWDGLMEASQELPDPALLTEGLPPRPEDLRPVPREQKDMAWAYFQGLLDPQADWGGVSSERREELINLARGLWLNYIMWDLNNATVEEQINFQAERENLMTANVARLLPQGKLFVHMGMGHTSQADCDYFPSNFVAWRLGQIQGLEVRSTGVITGGGTISYGGRILELPVDYPWVHAALDGPGEDAWLVPTHPDGDCRASGLGAFSHSNVGNLLEPAYDALIYFDQLRPIPAQ